MPYLLVTHHALPHTDLHPVITPALIHHGDRVAAGFGEIVIKGHSRGHAADLAAIHHPDALLLAAAGFEAQRRGRATAGAEASR